MVGKANRLPTTADNQVRNNRNERDLFALTRSRVTTKTVQPPPKTGVGAGSNLGGDPGNFLRTQGDTMIGPIAFAPATVFIDNQTDPTNPSIDIGPQSDNPPDYSTYVYVSGSGTDDKLSTIFGAAFAGQLLKLQAIVDIEITDGESETFGNIITNNNASLNVLAGSITEFIFDVTSSPNGVEGAWRLASTGNPTGEEDAFLVARLSGNYAFDGIVPWDLSFPLGDPERIIVTATDGVFELVDGVFTLDATLGLSMASGGSGSEALGIWQSATAEGGPWSDIANNSTVVSTFSTGRPDFTVQPLCTVLVDTTGTSLFVRVETTVISGSLNDVLQLPSFAIIEFLNGGSGGGSGGGASSLGELSDVTLTSPATDQVLTYDGAIWVNQAPQSGGMNTNLSNMISPTVPTVPLNMNVQDIDEVNSLDFANSGTRTISSLLNLQFFITGQSINSFSDRLLYQDPLKHDVAVAGVLVHSTTANELTMATGKRINQIADIAFALSGENQVINQFSLAYDPLKETQGTGIINVPQNKELIFEEQGTKRIGFQNFSGIGWEIRDNLAMVFGDATIFPTRTGEILRNGGDIYAFTSNGVKNLADIPVGGAGNSISQLDSNVTVTDTGTDGAITSTIDGALITTLNDAQYSINVPVFFTSNNLTGLGNTFSGGNHSFDFGGATLFWNSLYTDTVFFQNIGNFIDGDSAGMLYQGDKHEFNTGNQILEIATNAVNITNANLTLSGNRITGITLVPVADSEAASKKYVDDNSGGGTPVGVQDAELNTVHDTSEFDFKIWVTHGKQGDLDVNQSAGLFATNPTDTIYFYPFFIGESVTVDQIGIEIEQGSINVNDFSVAIYNSNGGQNYPTSRLSGSFNGFVNNDGVLGIPVNQALTPGLYWFALWWDDGNTNQIRGLPLQAANCVGWAADGNNALRPICAYTSVHTSNVLPANAPNDMSVYGLSVVPACFALLS